MSSVAPAGQDHSLQALIAAFLAGLQQENRSPHTRRAYASDLARFASFYSGAPNGITADVLRLIATTGLRIGEALSLYVEDLDLTLDDEHLRVVGKGQRPRTILLDDPVVVKELRAFLQVKRYRHGPLFRAEKNGRGGPLRYQAVQLRWQQYCLAAGVTCTLHQLRYTHATELMNAGVSLATIRKRLGHKHLQTTLRYAEQTDTTADADVRAWRRRVEQR